jgi:hypothetical protein
MLQSIHRRSFSASRRRRLRGSTPRLSPDEKKSRLNVRPLTEHIDCSRDVRQGAICTHEALVAVAGVSGTVTSRVCPSRAPRGASSRCHLSPSHQSGDTRREFLVLLRNPQRRPGGSCAFFAPPFPDSQDPAQTFPPQNWRYHDLTRLPGRSCLWALCRTSPARRGDFRRDNIFVDTNIRV